MFYIKKTVDFFSDQANKMMSEGTEVKHKEASQKP